ncbi:MAG: GDP-L-fucose synthase [Nitrospirota bacterium]
MNKTSRIYIAGHRGMVGSALKRLLDSQGYENVITRSRSRLDLKRQADVEKFIEIERPEYVFLAAAKVGGILANDTYKAEFIYDNIMLATNIIHSSYKYGAKKLLNLGSSCIYPKLAKQPMKEEDLLTGSLEPTNEPYAIAKIAALKMCRYYNEQYGTDYISLMPTNMYGPNDNFNLETAHVFAALIRKFHIAKLLMNEDFEQITRDILRFPFGFNVDNEAIVGTEEIMRDALKKLGISEKSVVIWGGGEIYREFMHVDDLADASIFLMKNCGFREGGEFINIGSGVDIKIRDLAVLISEIIGYEGAIEHDLTRPEGTPRKLLDVSKARELGWEAKISLEEGIRKVYQWYCN